MSPGGAGPGTLVLVATPIGNLGDLSPRAASVLAAADLVCCEDTRRTRALLSASGIPAAGRLLSLHAHNEATRAPRVMAELARGATVALVTDAGTPAVSDPGERLVAATVAAGHRVTTVPGPSAPLAALAVSGLPTERFAVEGFLPRRGAARARRMAELLADERTSVVLESPHRLGATLGELAALAPARRVAVCRELTKVHEEVWRGELGAAAEAFAAREVKGEVVVVVAGAARSERSAGPGDAVVLEEAVAVRLAEGLSTRDAADAAALALGVSRRRAYEVALAARRAGPS